MTVGGRAWWAIALAAALMLAACGGGGGGGEERDEPAEVAAPHTITFLGEVPEFLQDEIRFEADLVAGIFIDRFGMTPPETAITFATTRERLARAYRELTGTAPPETARCFAKQLADGRYAIFIQIGNCGFGYTVGEAAGFVLAHEYFHVLQLSLAPGLEGPHWLIEGSAEYAMAIFSDARKSLPYAAFRNAVLLRAASWTGSLRSAGADERYPPGHEHYTLGFLAVERLVELAGEEAILDYFRRAPASADWRDAFEAAFGVTVEAFYEAFEPYRAEAVADYRTIRGRVTGPGGEGVDGVTLLALDPSETRGGFSESAPDGSFSIGFTRDGSYRIEVYVFDAAGLCHLAGLYVADGAALATSTHDATYVAVEAGEPVTGMDVRLPAEPGFSPRAGYCIQ